MTTRNARPTARTSTARKPRADAQRNRERILEVAKQAFTRSGAGASLDDIARQAGVGAGTLYRHFPTREVLLEAVYRTELEKLAASEERLAGTLPPIEALRAWLLLFIDAIGTKKIIAPALSTLVGDPKKAFEASYRADVRCAPRAGEARGQERRHPAGPRSGRSPQGPDRRRQRRHQPRLAAERQETGRHPHRRLAAGPVGGRPVSCVRASS